MNALSRRGLMLIASVAEGSSAGQVLHHRGFSLAASVTGL
jgi:hypothetical protein